MSDNGATHEQVATFFAYLARSIRDDHVTPVLVTVSDEDAVDPLTNTREFTISATFSTPAPFRVRQPSDIEVDEHE